MDGADGWVGVILAAVAFAAKVAVDRWRSRWAAEDARRQALLESTIGRYFERRASYDAFRRSVHALLDGMDFTALRTASAPTAAATPGSNVTLSRGRCISRPSRWKVRCRPG